jgi:hypothetical protein
MSSRTHRKALPLDPRGIHWGNGERHESGTRWDSDEWKRFVAWAYENDAIFTNCPRDVHWRANGLLHRENGPAVIRSDGRDEWFLNGRRHQPDGPAVVWSNGYEAWWLHGQRHRPDGPAQIWPDGLEEWWLNGELHREDGPAQIWLNGHKEWWRNGVKYTDGTFTVPYYK